MNLRSSESSPQIVTLDETIKEMWGGGEAGGGHGGQGCRDDQGRQGGQSGHCGQSAQEIEMMEKDDYQAYLQNGESSAVICDAMLTDSSACCFEWA